MQAIDWFESFGITRFLGSVAHQYWMTDRWGIVSKWSMSIKLKHKTCRMVEKLILERNHLFKRKINLLKKSYMYIYIDRIWDIKCICGDRVVLEYSGTLTSNISNTTKTTNATNNVNTNITFGILNTQLAPPPPNISYPTNVFASFNSYIS